MSKFLRQVESLMKRADLEKSNHSLGRLLTYGITPARPYIKE